MKITKYEHACLVIEEDNQLLVVDPGILAVLPDLKDVVALFITHIHGDHLDKEKITKIVRDNPEVKIFGSGEVIASLKETSSNLMTAESGDLLEVGPFRIEVGGDEHAVIYQSSPCQNRSITINKTLFYSGDSFSMPKEHVELIAVPASAPWMKTSEAMEFIKSAKPKQMFPTQNGLLSDFGKEATYRWLNVACQEVGTELIDLKDGESLEV